MKRLHVMSASGSRRFGRLLFHLVQRQPTLRRPTTKWMLDDPRVNFAISSGNHAQNGIEHLGIQVENQDELAEVYGRLGAAGRPVLEESATTCCYAKSEKSWIADPDGIVWETFLTSGEATVYGDSPALTALSDNASDATCCAPAMPAAQAPPSCCG